MTTAILTTEIRSELDVMLVRQRGRQLAGLMGFDPQDQTRIATAVSEIARNAVQYAGSGKVTFQLTDEKPQTLQILVQDSGPGIADLDSLLHPSGVMRSAPGASLRGVCRLMDVCDVDTKPQGGTRVTLGKTLRDLSPIGNKDVARITGELARRDADDPVAEMRRQNQEILFTLAELRAQQEARAANLEEIQTLNRRLQRAIQATHHRVKNNLQIISALVDIQIDGAEDTVPVSALTRIGQHARGLAALHDLLTHETKTDAATDSISTQATLDKLMPLLQVTAGQQSLRHEVTDFPMPVKEGASLVLLISEMVSNAVKHGKSEIYVSLTLHEGMAHLNVSDDGPGFPPDFDWQKAANTGLSLIDSTGRYDLNGTLSFTNRSAGGACVSVVFPVPVPSSTNGF